MIFYDILLYFSIYTIFYDLYDNLMNIRYFMNNLIKNKIIENEAILLRKFRVNEFIVRRISSDNFKGSFDLMSLVKNPMIVSSKDDGLLFKIGITSMESFRTSSPIDIYTRLVVDYDNANSNKNLIDEFCNKFKNYSFILYTTFSSTNRCPKFRVIIKLRNPLFKYSLDNVIYRHYLSEVFSLEHETPDDSCFLPTQCQLVPTIMKEGKYCYRYVINKGSKLEVEDYEEFTTTMLNNFNKKSESYNIQDLNYIIDKTYFSNVYSISNERVREKCKPIEKHLIKIKDNNYKTTKEYKSYKKRLDKINAMDKIALQNSFYFSNKNDFLKHILPKAVDRRDLNYFYKEWKKYYKFDIRDNEKWNRKMKEFLPKLLNYMNVDKKELV